MSLYSLYGLSPIPYPTIRRTVFISYFHEDSFWAQYFVSTFGSANGVLIPKALGLNYQGADEIKSDDPDYVMDRIRERCIDSSSVQIVLVGTCTHSRRYIDWEIKRSLRAGNGLLGILLPPNTSAYLPERFQVNYCSDGSGYAQFRPYPTSEEQLRSWIEDAYLARTSRWHVVTNTNEVWGYNHRCRVCGIVH